MQGIQSLMPGQAQQAPMPGMMPQQSSSTPGAMTGSLKNMPMEQLKMLFQNPQPGSPPLWAVISALAEKQKEAQAIQAAMGQGAMAQNAQMQQQPPVAAQVVQAAQGGIMQGYAGGGAVAFDRGTGPQGLPQQNPEEDLSDDPSLPLRERWIRSQKRAELSRQQGVGRSFAERFTAPTESTTDTGDELSRMLGRVPAPVPMSMRDTRGMTPATVAAARNLGIGQVPQQRQQAQQVQQAAQPAPVAPSDLTPEMLKAFADREAQMRGRLVRPESLTRAEEGLAALAKANIEAQRAEAEAYGKDIRAAREAALAQSQRSILEDPQALLALAGSIDARRGQAIGSLARGAAGVMGQRQAAAEAARKEFTQAQRDERTMQANLRQTQMLEAQRQVALEKGKLDEVNDINYKLAQLGMEREQFRLTRGDKAFEQAIEGRKVAATERTARAAEINAGKPSEMDIALNRPEEYARVLKARAEATQARVSPEDRRAATMERYADNWEKLDMMQKSELAKQGVTNFQQYVRMRDQMTAGNIPQAPSQGTPAVGTVMQGYRFKGGNPADKNNWEKV
jgi:hypothetical protein